MKSGQVQPNRQPASPTSFHLKLFRRFRYARQSGLLALSLACLAVPLAAQPLYWDTDGATSGAGGPTPTGTWGTDDFWSTDPLGEVVTGPWT